MDYVDSMQTSGNDIFATNNVGSKFIPQSNPLFEEDFPGTPASGN